jgi:hypothetical protein
MEKVLHQRTCKLTRNDNGLYDLSIMDGSVPVTVVHNVTLQRAVVTIEDYMHTKARNE